jgi:hypothetical protein
MDMSPLPPAQIAEAAIDRGEVLIAGMAAMLICIFLGPKFIEWIGSSASRSARRAHRSITPRRGPPPWAG